MRPILSLALITTPLLYLWQMMTLRFALYVEMVALKRDWL